MAAICSFYVFLAEASVCVSLLTGTIYLEAVITRRSTKKIIL